MATEFSVKQRGRLATGVPEGRPARLHHVVARQGDKGLEVLRVPLEGKGETLPVFTAGWAARGYLFAETPGWEWYVRACSPGELASLLIGLCAGVEWVSLDPTPSRRSGGGAANVMPQENFVDYLLCSRPPRRSDGAASGPSEVRRMNEKTIVSERRGSVLFPCWTSKDEWKRRSTADPTRKASIFARTVQKPFVNGSDPKRGVRRATRQGR